MYFIFLSIYEFIDWSYIIIISTYLSCNFLSLQLTPTTL